MNAMDELQNAIADVRTNIEAFNKAMAPLVQLADIFTNIAKYQSLESLVKRLASYADGLDQRATTLAALSAAELLSTIATDLRTMIR